MSNIVELKRKEIQFYIKSKGYNKSEVAVKLGRKPTNFIHSLNRLQTLSRLEKLEKEIKEVI